MSVATVKNQQVSHCPAKAYAAYRETSIPWIDTVPITWSVRRLKTSLVRNDGGVWGDDFDDEGTVVLRSTEQTVSGDWRIEDPARRALSATDRAAARLSEGDLVITKSSGSELHIGKTSIVTAEVAALECCFSNFMQRLRCDRGSSPRFVYYILNSPIGREQMVYGSNTSTGLANLNSGVIGNIIAAWPPLEEQEAISDWLDDRTKRIDELVTAKRRLIELLAEQRTSLITQTVTKGLNGQATLKSSGIDWLGDVPSHWDVAPMYARYHVELGKMLDAKRITGQHSVPYLRNVDVRWDSIRVDDLPEMDIEPSEYHRFILKPGDLLICEGGEVGRAALWCGQLEQCAYQKAIHRVRPIDEDRDAPRFLYYVMYAASKSGILIAHGNPNTIPHLTGEALRVYRFAFPPLDEQLAIVQYLDRTAGRLDALTEKADAAIRCLIEYRQSLITAAVTGKIDVRHTMEVA